MPQNDKMLLQRLLDHGVEFVVIGGVCGVWRFRSGCPRQDHTIGGELVSQVAGRSQGDDGGNMNAIRQSSASRVAVQDFDGVGEVRRRIELLH